MNNQAVKVSGEELVRRAHDMIPMLRSKSDEIERNGKVSPEVIDAFREAGFFKILQQSKWGGYEMDLETFVRVLMEIGAGDTSSAWVLGVLALHNWEMALFDERAAEEVWGNDPNVLISSSYAPFGTATKVDGGWILNGTWRSSSGIDYADWTIVGAYEFGENGEVLDLKGFLVPKKQYKMEDDWDVYGLQGTGSKSLVVDNVFVPDYRAHSIIEAPWGNRPPLYLLNQTFVFKTTISSVIIGFAQAAIDYYIEEMKTRKTYKIRQTGNTSAKESPYVKDRLGNAVLKVRSSKARVFQVIREAYEYVNRGEPVPIQAYATYALDTAAAGKECAEAVLLLHRAQSARGVWRRNPIQRIFRDIHAGANHATQNADDTAGMLGGLLLGEGFPPRVFNHAGLPPEM